MEPFKHWREHLVTREESVGKATLFESPRLLLGLNALEPGAVQAVHIHEGQDKFYQVIEGTGHFTVGDDVRELGPGHAIWAPAGVEHGVVNRGRQRLVLLVGIAPSP